MSTPASSFNALATRLAVSVYFSLAPATVPPWRLAPTIPPARVLPIGEPVPRPAARVPWSAIR
ncbi:MAG: hypothetical protein P1T08_16615 [Acidimicrobiia bacterium]|nr:hypothetical protein [Acidimicrobiia bacterium]